MDGDHPRLGDNILIDTKRIAAIAAAFADPLDRLDANRDEGVVAALFVAAGMTHSQGATKAMFLENCARVFDFIARGPKWKGE